MEILQKLYLELAQVLPEECRSMRDLLADDETRKMRERLDAVAAELCPTCYEAYMELEEEAE